MEENIEGLGGEDIFILHEDHRPTGLIGTWEFCKDYKESGNFQTGVPVCFLGDLELLDLNISPLKRSAPSVEAMVNSLWVPPLRFRS